MYYALRKKIIDMLNSDEVVSDQDTISAYDLYQKCHIVFDPVYNVLNNTLDKKYWKIPFSFRIKNMFYVNYKKEGKSKVDISLIIGKDTSMSMCCFKFTGENVLILDHIDSPKTQKESFLHGKMINFIKNNNNQILQNLELISMFSEAYDCNINKNLISESQMGLTQEFSNGFMKVKFDLSNSQPDIISFELVNKEEEELSSKICINEGVLRKIIEEDLPLFLKRIPISISNLKPLYRKAIDSVTPHKQFKITK